MDMGLSMTAAFTIFAKTVTREKRIPFEVSADPFYSASNMKHLQRGGRSEPFVFWDAKEVIET